MQPYTQTKVQNLQLLCTRICAALGCNCHAPLTYLLTYLYGDVHGCSPDGDTVDPAARRQSLGSRQSLIDGVRRLRQALMSSKDTSKTSPSLARRTILEVDEFPAANDPQAKRPSTSSEG